jgi:predicted GNAT family N-acyltransferase
VGGAVLAKLMEAAKSRGDREVLLSAQVHAVPFYQAYGFEVSGEVYEEAGIPHRDMRRTF